MSDRLAQIIEHCELLFRVSAPKFVQVKLDVPPCGLYLIGYLELWTQRSIRIDFSVGLELRIRPCEFLKPCVHSFSVGYCDLIEIDVHSAISPITRMYFAATAFAKARS